MSTTAIAVVLVLLSAIMHAGWNLLLKMSGDKLITVWGIRLFSLSLAIPFVLFDPPSEEVLPYIIVSGLLHTLYDMALISAYHLGEYSLVYTFARGMSPALSALIAYFILEESLTPLAIVGLLVTVAGLLMVTGAVRTSHDDTRRAILWSLVTAGVISTYTVVDAAGVRIGGNAFTYVGGVFITNLFWQTPITLWKRWGHRDWAILRLEWPKTLLASILQIVSYSLVVFAFGVSMVGYISSLRETGVVFAALFGWWFFKDPFGRLRIVGTMAVVAGVVALSVGGAV